MSYINSRMPVKQFHRPSSGLVVMEVCSVSGMIPTDACTDGTLHELFLAGTEPKTFCPIHKFEASRDDELTQKYLNDFSSSLISAPGIDLLEDPYSSGGSGYDEVDDGMIDFLLNDPFSNTNDTKEENTYLLD